MLNQYLTGLKVLMFHLVAFRIPSVSICPLGEPVRAGFAYLSIVINEKHCHYQHY
ncbi:MAG: hypothetical protein NC347_05865 [Clostridium sp.]|nr:hypothetical protein [Clostridium sp.]